MQYCFNNNNNCLLHNYENVFKHILYIINYNFKIIQLAYNISYKNIMNYNIRQSEETILY